MNESNEVVGFFRCFGNPSTGFARLDDGSITIFPETSRIVGISNTGLIGGTRLSDPPSGAPGGSAFTLDLDGTINYVGTVPGGNYSKARGMAEDGTLVGEWGHLSGHDDVAANQAYVFFPDRSSINIHERLDAVLSIAHAVNSYGVVIGTLTTEDLLERLFIWDRGTVTELGLPPGAIESRAVKINEMGQILGIAIASAKPFDLGEGFVWTHRTLMRIRPAAGYLETLPSDINNLGQVVGKLQGEGLPAPFLWQHGTTFVLDDLVSLPAGIMFQTAKIVNDYGIIAGTGIVNGDGAIILLGPSRRVIGDVDVNCRVDVNDLNYLLSQWGSADTRADVNVDGHVGFDDLVQLLGHWGEA